MMRYHDGATWTDLEPTTDHPLTQHGQYQGIKKKGKNHAMVHLPNDIPPRILLLAELLRACRTNFRSQYSTRAGILPISTYVGIHNKRKLKRRQHEDKQFFTTQQQHEKMFSKEVPLAVQQQQQTTANPYLPISIQSNGSSPQLSSPAPWQSINRV